MNVYFKEWVLETIPKMKGNFTSQQVLEEILKVQRNGHYVGNTRQIGYLLRLCDDCIQNGDRTWRNKNEEGN